LDGARAGGPHGKGVIDLAGLDTFKGLFTVETDVESFAEAPLIRNVHVKNGKTAEDGGFIVQYTTSENAGNIVWDKCSWMRSNKDSWEVLLCIRSKLGGDTSWTQYPQTLGLEVTGFIRYA
jgi:hypothetical protein